MPSYYTQDGWYVKCALFGMQVLGVRRRALRACILEMSGSDGSWKGTGPKSRYLLRILLFAGT